MAMTLFTITMKKVKCLRKWTVTATWLSISLIVMGMNAGRYVSIQIIKSYTTPITRIGKSGTDMTRMEGNSIELIRMEMRPYPKAFGSVIHFVDISS